MNTSNLRQHWFFVAAPLILATDILVGLLARGQIDLLIESGLLFDLAVLVPCLYWLCYRHKGKAAIIKAAALACLGIWIALKLIPEPERQLLNYVEPLRYVGLAVLLWLELVVVVAIYRSVFKGATVDQAAKETQDLPSWVVRLLAWEARFWLKCWQWMKRIVGRR
jgi:uncharacterized membrane protein YGL010W